MWGENLMASRTSPARNSWPVEERTNQAARNIDQEPRNVAVHSWKSSSRTLSPLFASQNFNKILSTLNIIINKFLVEYFKLKRKKKKLNSTL